MAAPSPSITFSAKDAKAKFGELLDEALAQPVGITKHDRLTAYVVSKRDFERLLANIERLEDQLWLAKAELARQSGFVSPERTQQFLADFEGVRDAETGNHE